MTKKNKINVIVTVAFVIAIIATVAEIISCIREARILDWLPISTTFSAFAIAFSCLSQKKTAEEK